MPWFSPNLDSLLAVAAATLDEDGGIIEANAGFLRLLRLEAPSIGAPTARVFVQPDFATLAHLPAGPDGEMYRGLLTLGDVEGTHSLLGRLWRVGTELRLLAEYDVTDLERHYDTVLDLNRDYALAQFEVAQANLRLRQRETQILAASLTDPLTGIGNRRRLDEALAAEIARADRTGERCSVVMADLDHFKRINDTYGHEAGDTLLAAFGALLRREARATDVATRFGGEEFVVVLPYTDLAHALAMAERIRAILAATRVEPHTTPVTASFGVAERSPGEPGESLLRRADTALYEAKHAGRNCVVAAAAPAIALPIGAGLQ